MHRGVEGILRKKAGFDTEVIGETLVEKALEHRMRTCGLDDVQGYLAQLESSDDEWREFVEEVIVSETWFFRDEEPFNFLQHHAASAWLPFQSAWKKPLRLLSVPCATGEEPYSIAIALAEAGLQPRQFQIEAVDISARSLLVAKHGMYRSRSFRGASQKYRERWFRRTGEEFRIDREVAGTVRFTLGNIASEDFLAGAGPFDAIFCRNLLIYLNRDTRRRVLNRLDQLLRRDGLLFVGHAEALDTIAAQFEPVKHPRAFAYRRKDKPRAGEARSVTRILAALPSLKPVREQRARPAAPQPPRGALEEAPPPRPADRGKLDEAAAVLKEHLKKNGTSVEAWFLLGMLWDALRQENQAETCLQKALYLDAMHYEAAVQLAVIAEKRGDRPAAARLKQRAQRIMNSREAR